ncbi:amino acid transporter [Microbacterium aurum]|uniref:Amino acid transporter n=1 Tax=Microbacterium aurum TaxID=36805 RepID=A0A1P8U6A7_9MICO|nr:LysE/ArgO family amino acid transporter [Microbacterium aurum]APZ33624.1 amino acid transporter [Microbacterium aurum]MBM7827325.1 L-lysine exporter family protein LysE/ArgO [Microbacterium aurum]
MTTALLAGFGLGLSLIVAIGAQNLFVLRQGIRREYALAVGAVCAVSDAALIALGVSGLGFVLHSAPWLVTAVRWAGFAFLLCYGVLAARRALRGSGEALVVDGATPVATARETAHPRRDGQRDAPSRHECPVSPDAGAAVATAAPARLLPVLATCLALTWLNPHVYLDTVFLLGSVASTHGADRWWFAAGAATASVVWFFALALGARYLGRWLATPRAWRILDGVIAVVMIAIAVSLVWPA